jgi:Nif-specific regulatory protein
MARFSLVVSRVYVMESLIDKVRGIEKEEILNALKDCNWVMSKAARKLGITERMIGYKIKKYQITIEVRDRG